MDAVSNILTHRKKIKVPTQISPQKFVNFPLTPRKTRRDQRMPTDLTTQKRLWGHSSEKLIHGPGGRGGMARYHNLLPADSFSKI